jgi:hypothetical protein
VLRILQIVSVFLVAIGGVMNLFSNLVALAPYFPSTEDDRQFWGLLFLTVGIILFMLATFIEGIVKDATRPRLSWGYVNTAYKPLHTQYKLSKELVATDLNIHSELEFAFLDISNNPCNQDDGRIAERAHATITFDTEKDGKKVIKSARWCDEHMPLFQPSGDAKSLKTVDIVPGNPESLIVAFRHKHGNEVYAFDLMDHTRTATKQDLDNLKKERFIGKAPIKFQVKIEGRFKTQVFDLTLAVNSDGDFTVYEKR